MKTAKDVLSTGKVSTVLASEIGVTSRTIRKARQGRAPALARVQIALGHRSRLRR